jgi:outer membrane receptor protein involved in Fe transport
VNYLPGETNNQVTPLQKVGSWTTVDASLRYTPVLPGVLSGIHFSVAVLNAFNRDPPFVQLATAVTPGLNYDSSNTNPMGRFVSVQISKEW